MPSLIDTINIFFEKIMLDAQVEHDKKVNIGDRTITSLRFGGDIGTLAEDEQGLEAILE